MKELKKLSDIHKLEKGEKLILKKPNGRGHMEYSWVDKDKWFISVKYVSDSKKMQVLHNPWITAKDLEGHVSSYTRDNYLMYIQSSEGLS